MRYNYIIIFAIAVLFSACGERNHAIADWGSTVYYSDFWWKHYESSTMDQTLVLDFNDDAHKHFTGEAVLELMIQKGEDFLPTVDLVTLCKNDIECKQNRLVLTPTDNEVKVSVEFKAEAPSGNYKLFLVPIDKGGLDEIVQVDLGEGFFVQKIDIMNPLAKQTMWLAIVIAVLFVAWLILSRIINPYLKFSRISFDYNNGAGELSHRVGGCYKIICTNKPKRISLLHKIFVGNVHVEVNDFWSNEVTIMCGSRNNLRLITRGDYILPDDPVRKEPFTIQDEQQRKVNIETT